MHQRRHHFLARIGLAHATAHTVVGRELQRPHLPSRPARGAPDARAARGLEQASRDIAADLGAHAAFELRHVAHLHVHARLGIREIADENGGDAVLLADLAQRYGIELPRAHGGEELRTLAEFDETRARLRRLHLLLELPGRPGADRALGVRVKVDNTDRRVALEIHARRNGNHHRARAGG